MMVPARMPFLDVIAISCAMLLAAYALNRFLSRVIWHYKRRRTPVSTRRVDMFLNRLLFKSNMDRISFVTFRIDCFLFDFGPKGLVIEIQDELFQYMKTLDLAQQQAILKIYIWLMQHEVQFELRYSWNWDLPLAYNIRQIRKSAYLKSLIDSVDRNALMAYDLASDTHALHP